MQSTDEIEQMMSEASIDAVTAARSIAQQELGPDAAGLQNRMIEQIVQDDHHPITIYFEHHEPVIIYTMEQLTDVLAAVNALLYVAGSGIQDTMLINYQPQPADQCPVCLVEVAEEEGDSNDWVSLSLCSHRFHRTCICRWPRTTCPLCRANHAV